MVKDFVSDSYLIDLYTSIIPKEIENYKPGSPEMKPDVLKQIAKMTKEREEMA